MEYLCKGRVGCPGDCKIALLVVLQEAANAARRRAAGQAADDAFMEGAEAEEGGAAAGQGDAAEGAVAAEDEAAAAERLHATQLALELRAARGEPAAVEEAGDDDTEEAADKAAAGTPAAGKVCHAHNTQSWAPACLQEVSALQAGRLARCCFPGLHG